MSLALAYVLGAVIGYAIGWTVPRAKGNQKKTEIVNAKEGIRWIKGTT